MRTIILLLSMCLFFKGVNANDNPAYPYYIVVGGFADKENAERFSNYVHDLNIPAQVAFNNERSLYYVFVHDTYDKGYAKTMTYSLRQKGGFKTAWIYNGPLFSEESFSKQRSLGPQGVVNQIRNLSISTETVVNESQLSEIPYDVTGSSSGTSAKPIGKPIVFKLINAATKTPIQGNVKLVESEKFNRYQCYQANELVYIPSPKNNTGKLVIECDLVGYKLVKKAINYEKLLKEYGGTAIDEGQELVIPIELNRLKRGTYIDFEGVKFYEHSDIFTSESEQELLELLALMQNPKYKIRLHGHVGDEKSREIVVRGHSKDFFSLNEAKHRVHSSAKKLSHYRANAIKEYLVSKGVSAKRIKTKSYGASLAVFESDQANDRIEIEILK